MRIVSVEGHQVDIDNLSDNPGILRFQVVARKHDGASLTGPLMLMGEVRTMVDTIRWADDSIMIRVDNITG